MIKRSHSLLHAQRTARGVLCALLTAVLASTLVSCGGSAGGGTGGGSDEGTTSGPAFEIPPLTTAAYNADAATGANGGSIDTSSVEQGYVAASATNESRLKLQVIKGDASYNYDLSNDGTPIICPLNMGNGSYTFRIMQNTSGTNYVEITSATAEVAMESDFAPYVRPNVYCDYNENSACVTKARELAQGAANQGDVLQAVYDWITSNISYDSNKASQLANATGYVPNPDATLQDGSGICFDYVSLGAAMLRSLGIPCKIITGYVSPDGIYHAWNMVYLDGGWVNVRVNVTSNTWTLIDFTFASAGSSGTIGDGTSYTERYTY